MIEIALQPIGTIHTPFTEPRGTPIQPTGARDVQGTVEVLSEYLPGLDGLDGFSHVILIYLFHKAQRTELEVTPFMDDRPHGVFATRAPARPNHLGLSVVRLDGIEGGTLRIRDVDMLDGTPLLDIKPYVPEFDARAEARIGWLADNVGRLDVTKDDGRFVE